jgi:hypothetical protein
VAARVGGERWLGFGGERRLGFGNTGSPRKSATDELQLLT